MLTQTVFSSLAVVLNFFLLVPALEVRKGGGFGAPPGGLADSPKTGERWRLGTRQMMTHRTHGSNRRPALANLSGRTQTSPCIAQPPELEEMTGATFRRVPSVPTQ